MIRDLQELAEKKGSFFIWLKTEDVKYGAMCGRQQIPILTSVENTKSNTNKLM